MTGHDDGHGQVLEAVEKFIALHNAGRAPDPEDYGRSWPDPLRDTIARQCREYLRFDGMVGPGTADGGGDGPGGREIGDFVIHEELGRGGMGTVYLAEQKSLGRRVALKVLAGGLTLSRRHVDRFRREAAATARLHHPGIVPVHSFTEIEGLFAFAMDYVPGRTLAELLDELRLRQSGEKGAGVEGALGVEPDKGYVAEVALLAAQIASALAAAHRAGIVHRDIKPRNVMIDEHGQARLLDFGLAKDLREGSLSVSGEITGTAHYMSPEQTLAKRVALDHRTDIFSLGVILYELLTLARPFDGDDLQQVVYRICFVDPVPIPRRNPQVPRDLATICMKALEKEPAARYATAEEMEADLRRFLRWEPIRARPASLTSRVRKWIHRHRAQAAGVAVGGLAVAIALGIWTRSSALAYQREVRAHRLLAQSGQAMEDAPELALRLALEGAARHEGPVARSSVLAALGTGHWATSLMGHEGNVSAAVFRPGGGDMVATGGYDNRVLLWEPDQGEVIRTLEAHDYWILCLGFSGDGRLLASGGADSLACIWDPDDGRLLQELRHGGAVDHVAFDAGGERLLTVSNAYEKKEFEAVVWDVAGGERVATLDGHESLVMTAALSPDGRHAVTSTLGPHARLWDVEGGGFVRLGPHGGRMQVAFSPDGRSVATACEDCAVRVFSVPDGEPECTVRHSGWVEMVQFSPDGQRLLTASRDQTARIWSRDGRELLTLTGHGAQVPSARFDRSGRYVVTASHDRRVRVFDAGSGKELARLPVGQKVRDARFDREGERVLVRAGQDGIKVWRHRVRYGERSLGHDSIVWSAAFDAAGGRVVTAGNDEKVCLWSTVDGRLLQELEGFDHPVRCAAFDPDGQRLLVATEGGEVAVWSLNGGQRLFVLRGSGDEGRGSAVAHARFGADGRHILAAGADGRARLWRVQDQELVAVIERPSPLVFADLGPDGRRIVTVEEGEEVARVWEARTGRAVAVLGGHGLPVASAVFDAAGERVLTASADQTARLIEVATGEVVREFRGHHGPLTRAVFSGDGTMVATTGGSPQDHTVRLWDTASGGELLTFHSHHSKVTSVAFSADGGSVVSASYDRTARIWPTDPLAVARRLPVRELTSNEREHFGLPPAEPEERDP